MSLRRSKAKEARKSGQGGSQKAVMATKTVTKLARKSAPKLAIKASIKPAIKAAVKLAIKPAVAVKAVKVELAKPVIKAAEKPALKLKAALKTKAALKPVVVKEERIHSHPTMCLHCHLIVEMFHERGADPVKGAWQCPRCGHKYLFSHWKIKRQARGKTEAA